MMERNIKQGKRGKVSRYDLPFRRKVIEELYSGQISHNELLRKYDLTSGSIWRWRKWYDDQQALGVPLESMAEENGKAADQSQEQDQGQTVAELQEALRLANLKVTCLETLIDVAKQDLGIDIRKKPGTRSSAE